jgi:7-carboxy-7-deazaguanine synthase
VYVVLNNVYGDLVSKIKLAELFYSCQGEGRYMGVPSVFLRTFGCNFTCGGFGMPKGEISSERDVIATTSKSFTSYGDLPLVSSGCDSYASWDVRFKHLSPLVETNSIVESIMEMLPHKKWVDEHLVITGGEPLLGWQRAYPDLLDHSEMYQLKELTFETNGTQKLSPEFEEYLFQEWTRFGRDREKLTFSVSPKLSVSGETWKDAILPDIILQYQSIGHTYLKFVIASKEDAEEADLAIFEYRKAGFDGSVYLMPVGGTESVYAMNNRTVAELALKRGLRYSDRLQVPLFKNAWGT